MKRQEIDTVISNITEVLDSSGSNKLSKENKIKLRSCLKELESMSKNYDQLILDDSTIANIIALLGLVMTILGFIYHQ